MNTHNPLKFAAEFGAKLATRSRHICALLGAGVGKACSLPDVKELEKHVRTKLTTTKRNTFDRLLDERNIEQVLSRLRRYAGFVPDGEKVDGLTTTEAEDMDRSICRAIIDALDVKVANLTPVDSLAAWVSRADYRYPVELFTVNYDLLLETALEKFGVPYFDGFVGTLRARFRTELVEAAPDATSGVPPQFVRLWKLHGSVNWERTGNEIVRVGQPVSDDLPAAIYPSDTKYEESRRVPFLVLQDRLRRALHQPETLMLISGFSFGDDHLNEMIFDAATRRERSEFVVFSFDDITDDLANRAKNTPNIQVIGKSEAILGGVRAEWEAIKDEIPDLWVDGSMLLADFTHLATYLARSSTQDGEAYDDA